MGLNRRKMEDQRRQAAEKETVARRATDAQVVEDAERLIDAWNERQAKRMPMLFSPTIGAAIASRSEMNVPTCGAEAHLLTR
jgi:beta-phosphoglucomutase-like phosphatase (HAD superfamily)